MHQMTLSITALFRPATKARKSMGWRETRRLSDSWRNKTTGRMQEAEERKDEIRQRDTYPHSRRSLMPSISHSMSVGLINMIMSTQVILNSVHCYIQLHKVILVNVIFFWYQRFFFLQSFSHV